MGSERPMIGRDQTLYKAMHSAAPIIKTSPIHAAAGACLRPESKATATPATAKSTPHVLRRVMVSEPSIAPATIVRRGSVDKASAPRDAVVNLSEALNSAGNSAKKSIPRPTVAGQSVRGGHFALRAVANGASNRKPKPNRSDPSASGSIAAATNRVAPTAAPPSALDAIAAKTPKISLTSSLAFYAVDEEELSWMFMMRLSNLLDAMHHVSLWPKSG